MDAFILLWLFFGILSIPLVKYFKDVDKLGAVELLFHICAGFVSFVLYFLIIVLTHLCIWAEDLNERYKI